MSDTKAGCLSFRSAVDGAPVAGTRESAPVLLFLHGIGGDARMWQAQLADPQLAATRRIAVDLPGYGGNLHGATGGHAVVPPGGFAGMAARLVELLDALDIDTCVPVGHSMGGMVAQTLWRIAPARIEALVLACTSPAFGSSDGDWQQRFVASRLAPLDQGRSMADVAAALVPGMLAPEVSPGVEQAAIEMMSAVPAATYRAALQALVAFDGRAVLPTIDVPTLLIAAEHDRNVSPAVMQKMAARIREAEYRCVDRAGHLLPMQRPQAFDELVADFLRRRVPAHRDPRTRR